MIKQRTSPTRHAQASIKWIRLQEICLTMCGPGKILHVHGSTDLPIDLRAAVSKEGPRIDIMMNLLYNKNLDEVIESLAHELAHIILCVGDEGHDETFYQKMEAVRKKITKEYAQPRRRLPLAPP